MNEDCCRLRQHELSVGQHRHATFRIHLLKFRLVRVGTRTMMRDERKLERPTDLVEHDVRRKR